MYNGLQKNIKEKAGIYSQVICFAIRTTFAVGYCAFLYQVASDQSRTSVVVYLKDEGSSSSCTPSLSPVCHLKFMAFQYFIFVFYEVILISSRVLF